MDESRLRERYRPRGLLPGGAGTVVTADGVLTGTVDRLMRDTGLDRLPAADR
ncbi:hypothetical protein [Streptomyces sp. DH-12]|uniref:hypothetical protein n=1 Tax=Streptomyces sp. DH-12 TaxID=2072509 RepID=UPI0013008242